MERQETKMKIHFEFRSDILLACGINEKVMLIESMNE